MAVRLRSARATPASIASVTAGSTASLLFEATNRSPGDVVRIPDGTYNLEGYQSLEIDSPRVTIESASGNREACIISGGYNCISVNNSGVIIRNLTLKNPVFHCIQVRGEKGIDPAPIIRNCHMINAGQQFVKITASTTQKYADNGVLAHCLIEYLTESHGTATTPPSYTSGIDLVGGIGWVIRDNVLRRIRGESPGTADPTILCWRNSTARVERNVMIDCWRGIALGLAEPNATSRGGVEAVYDHSNGIAENNLFLAINEVCDAAIENNYALNSIIRRNTVYYTPSLTHNVTWGLEYRYTPTTATFTDNLSNKSILKRSPLPSSDATLSGNITNAVGSYAL